MLPYGPVTLVALFSVPVPSAFGIFSRASADSSSFFLCFLAFLFSSSVCSASSTSLSLSLLPLSLLSLSPPLVSPSASLLLLDNGVRNEGEERKKHTNQGTQLHTKIEGQQRRADRPKAPWETRFSCPASPVLRAKSTAGASNIFGSGLANFLLALPFLPDRLKPVLDKVVADE